MNRAKAFAVFFTLLLFGSLGQTLYLLFALLENKKSSTVIAFIVAVLGNIILLYLAIRNWRRTIRENN